MTAPVTNIQLYEILKQKLGNKEAEALVEFVDIRIKEGNEQNMKSLATKEDIYALKEDMAGLNLKISETKTDIIRWVFAFMVTLMLAIVGLYVRK